MTVYSTTTQWAVLSWVKSLAALVLTAVMLQVAVAAEDAAGPGAIASQTGVFIDNAWVRAMPPSQPNTAAYLTVRNEGEISLRIVAASSDPQAAVEIHTSREVDGMVSMQRLEGVTLKPGQSVEFAPGGMHLMMMGLNKMPAPGEQVKLCLQFDSGTSVCADAEVRRVAPSSDHQQHHNHEHH